MKNIDYLSITAFATKGNASTAVAGVFSGQLFNFLVGFAGSLFIQGLDGDVDFALFDFEGSVFDIISDSIVMVVIVSILFYLILMLVISWKTKYFLF